MSDSDVKLLLREKNIEITKNKLVLDIENNIDSLKKNVENIVDLEMTNNERILEKDFNIKNDLLIHQIKKIILDFIYKKIDDINLISREFVYKEDLNKNFNNKYKVHFLNCSGTFFENIDDINIQIDKVFKNIDALKSVENKVCERLISRINDKILHKVNTQIIERTSIILNNSIETYNKYLLLNQKTK